VVSIAGTNDEWTTSGLTVHPGDLIIVRAGGLVKVGQYTGEVDANGSAGNGVGILQIKVGVGAGKPAGKSALHVSEVTGEVKFRVSDSRYDDNSGEFSVDVLIIPVSALPPVASTSDPK
jgi:hypothetical protein